MTTGRKRERESRGNLIRLLMRFSTSKESNQGEQLKDEESNISERSGDALWLKSSPDCRYSFDSDLNFHLHRKLFVLTTFIKKLLLHKHSHHLLPRQSSPRASLVQFRAIRVLCCFWIEIGRLTGWSHIKESLQSIKNNDYGERIHQQRVIMPQHEWKADNMACEC